ADFRGDRGGRHGRGHRGGMRGGEMFRDVFDAADADGDGTVTQAEIDAYRDARVSEVDVSGDGALSIEEFDTLYRDLTRSRMVDAFQALDADGDGQISAEEMDRRVARFVERMDRDGDGALTLQRPGRRAPQE
ncbi:MAG: EF-hand domain-containing protein, partial [Pseudomonadota bacterium]